METFKLVMPENMNHYGYLFGGYMLMWVDEIAWVAATLAYPKYKFVTIGMDKIEFRKSVTEGVILRFSTTQTRVGNTSVDFLVEVTKANKPESNQEPVFSTNVTLVRIDEQGKKAKIGG